MVSREENKKNQIGCPDALHSRTWNKAWACNDDRVRLDLILKNLVGETVFDFGYGDGIMSIEFARAGYKVFGVNINPTEMADANKHLSQEPQEVKDRITWMMCDIENIPEEYNNTVDTIVCSEVLEHVYDPREILKKAKLVGKPGAKMIVTVPNRDVKVGFMPRWWLPNVHIREFNKTNLIELLSDFFVDIKFYKMYEHVNDDDCSFLLCEGKLK